MPDVSIKVLDKGPLYVTGPVDVVDAEGHRFETSSQVALCRCGESENKPFCDGAHKTEGFSDCVRAKAVL